MRLGKLFLAISVGCATQEVTEITTTLDKDLADPAVFHRAVAEFHMAREQWDHATDQLHRARRIDPDSRETWVLLGIVYRERSLYTDAEVAFHKAIDIDDDFAPAYSHLGILYDRRGKPKKALAMHKKALELDEEQAQYHNNMGFSLYLSGKYLESIPAFRAAIRLGTGDRVHNNLGFAYGRLGKPARAFREFKLGGTDAEAHNNLGFVYENMGDFKRAEEAYFEALRLDPTLARAKTNLAGVAKLLGHPVPQFQAAEKTQSDPLSGVAEGG